MRKPSQTIILIAWILIAFGLRILEVNLSAQAPHGTQSEEVPFGLIDGVNSTFKLQFQPLPWASIHVYRNGVRQRRNVDYTLGGPGHQEIIFVPLPVQPPGTVPVVIPTLGDSLLADYTY